MTTQTEMSLNGRVFQVEKTAELDLDGRTRYLFTGKRGATYMTMRIKKQQEVMFLFNIRGGIPAGFESTYLTDRNGSLEVLS